MNQKFTLIIKKSEVMSESTYCPYCGDEERKDVCCGEVHFEIGYKMTNGEVHLESEIDGWVE